MPLAFEIFLVVLVVCFYIGLLVYIDKMPKTPFVPQPPEEPHFTVAQSRKALEILNSDGQMAPKQLAERMGVSTPVAEAILMHLGKSDFVRLNVELDVVPPTFLITPRGQEAIQ